MGFFKKRIVENYFLEKENPYTKRRLLNTTALKWIGGVLGFLSIFGVLFAGGNTRRQEEASRIDYSSHIQPSISSSDAGSLNASPKAGDTYSGSPSYRGYSGYGRSASTSAARNRNSNQVIRRGEGGNDPTTRLPMGTGISARLVNAIWSADSNSPVIAEVSEDVFPPNSYGNIVAIPASTRAIGSASFDTNSLRIQIRIHTLVYPDGTQKNIQGQGLMADGSAGLAGDYHSGQTKRQVGKFIGNFVGGFAQGMKERSVGGTRGTPYEPGSLKNGLLNGISESASDEARSFSEGLGQTKPTMSLEAGAPFIIFLEQEFYP